MFYTYSQNNSGGRFRGPAMYVIVEADSPEQADDIATDNGLYFNGCSEDIDCPCCGDRWYTASEYDSLDTPEVYGTPVREYAKTSARRVWIDESCGVFALILYKGGRIVKVT